MGTGSAFIRLLRAGKPVALPQCGGRTVCPASLFLELGRQDLRDPAAWAKYCREGGELASRIDPPMAQRLLNDDVIGFEASWALLLFAVTGLFASVSAVASVLRKWDAWSCYQGN